MKGDPKETTPTTAPPQCSGLGALLGVLVAIAYYGFLIAGAVAPTQLAKTAIGGVPWSFLLGAALLVFIVLATGIYTLAANAAEGRA
jgi:uncharacterized membrane protein (DUF485 family)